MSLIFDTLRGYLILNILFILITVISCFRKKKKQDDNVQIYAAAKV